MALNPPLWRPRPNHISKGECPDFGWSRHSTVHRTGQFFLAPITIWIAVPRNFSGYLLGATMTLAPLGWEPPSDAGRFRAAAPTNARLQVVSSRPGHGSRRRTRIPRSPRALPKHHRAREQTQDLRTRSFRSPGSLPGV